MVIDYSAETKMLMQLHYSRLSEKDRRQYAAVEAIKLGHGGVTYISRVLAIDRNTIIQGKKQLMNLAEYEQNVPLQRQRRPGGGRKKKTAAPDINILLTSFIESYRAASPTDEKVYWISLKPWQLARLFYEKHQLQVSHGLV